MTDDETLHWLRLWLTRLYSRQQVEKSFWRRLRNRWRIQRVKARIYHLSLED